MKYVIDLDRSILIWRSRIRGERFFRSRVECGVRSDRGGRLWFYRKMWYCECSVCGGRGRWRHKAIKNVGFYRRGREFKPSVVENLGDRETFCGVDDEDILE